MFGLEMNFWELMFWLLVIHALADFPLQSEWMVMSKVRGSKHPDSSSRRPDLIWIHVLSSHAMVHGGGVALITQNIWLGFAEFVAHWIIDFLKGEGVYGFHTDQFLHITCKVAWACIFLYS